MIEEKWNWDERIVEAILTGDDVDSAVKALTMKKRQEADAYEHALKKQAENSRLLTAGLRMPEGSAGRRVADAIVEEMRARYPEQARKAAETIANRKKASDAESAWVASK